MAEDWGKVGSKYEIYKGTEYFDNFKYLKRVHRSHPGWNWPGINDGRWRPLLTNSNFVRDGGEKLEWLTPGTIFTIKSNLYRAKSWIDGKEKMLQAVEAIVENNGKYNDENLKKKGFIWIWHFDNKFFREVSNTNKNQQKKKDDRKPHNIDGKKKKKIIEDGKKHKAIVPTFTLYFDKSLIIPIPFPNISSSSSTSAGTSNMLFNQNEAEFMLVAIDKSNARNEVKYSETLKLKDELAKDINKNANEIKIIFTKMPIDEKYKFKLTIKPGKDKDGNDQDELLHFENKKFNELEEKKDKQINN